MNFSTISKLIPQNLKNNAFYKQLSSIYIRYRENKVYSLYSEYETILREIHDWEKGNTCIITGTGPSLQKVDTSVLDKYAVIGVNNSYKFYTPVYHMITDVHVLQRYETDLKSILAPIFLGSVAGLEYVTNKHEFNAVPIRNKGPMVDSMTTDITKGMKVADNVIVNALQLAFHMGFQNVYLVGCDFDYSGKEHFDGSKVSSITPTYTHGDWTPILRQLEICKDAYECTGRHIYNATVGGKLEVFPRKNIT